MIKKLIILVIILAIGGVVFMPEITSFSAKKAFEAENIDKPWAPETVYKAAKINMRFWRYRTARTLLEKGIDTFPTEAWVGDAHYQIGLCYEKIGDPTKAIEWYELFTQKYPNHEWQGQAKKRIVNIQANSM